MTPTRVLSVNIFGNQPDPTTGQMTIQVWSEAEAKKRARQKIFKILKILFGCSLIGLFLHLLLLLIIPTLILALIASIPLYGRLSSETQSCLEVHGICPGCKSEQKLRPYLSSRFKIPMSIQCPSCGQTFKTEPIPVNPS
jgi:hypothetical protein